MEKRSTVKKVLDRLTSVGGTAMSLFTGLMAAFLILYSGYVIYDNMYTQNQAFSSSWDLMAYRPEIIDDGMIPLAGGDTLASLNEDYRAWLTVYDTNIDYPVVQGSNDLYYSSHDIHKKSSLTGAIYLAAANSPDLSDPYNLIYGHHMDNGAMFGGLDAFADKDFFNSHRDAILVLQDAVYDLRIFAAVETDAYEDMIYRPGDRDPEELVRYISGNAVQYDEAEAAGAVKIMAMSTCMNVETNGRFVVFAAMTERGMTITDAPASTDEAAEASTSNTPDTPDRADASEGPAAPAASNTQETLSAPDGAAPEEESAAGIPLNPNKALLSADETEINGFFAFEQIVELAEIGEDEEIRDNETPLARFFNSFRPTGGSFGTGAWSLVNLITLIITVYLLIPLLHLKAKFGRGGLMKDVNRDKENLRTGPVPAQWQKQDKERILKAVMENRNGADPDAAVTEKEFNAAVQQLYYRQKKFSRLFGTGIILEIVVCAAAVIAFCLTEDLRLPMTLIDKWTPLMLLLLLACWLADVFLVRYRRNVEAEEAEGSDGTAAEA